MKLLENAGFLGRKLAVMVVGVLMLPTAWADGGYEQSGKNITVTGAATIAVTNVYSRGTLTITNDIENRTPEQNAEIDLIYNASKKGRKALEEVERKLKAK